MSSSLLKIFNQKLVPSLNATTVRYGHHLRGKPPGVAKTLEQRMEEMNYKDPELTYKVNIGLASKKLQRSKEIERRLDVFRVNRRDDEMERKARNKTLFVNLDKIRKDWAETSGPEHIKTIAEHYGVFEHLYGDAYFIPRVPMQIAYELKEGDLPVNYGNIIKPSEASKKPRVTFESEEGNLWTLIMSNPDGNLVDGEKEVVHWFVGNIPGNQIDRGETIVEYLQPFPPKGVGYQRLIFILYKQEKKLNYDMLRKEGSSLNLADRTFSTLDYYRTRQESITPASLAFFQSDYDKTLTNFFHKTLQMKEPIFEYDFPETYVKKQKWYPKREAFNLYMDRYRDPKQVNKEFLQRKLKTVHPFKPPIAELPFPNAKYFEGYVPSWLKLEKTKARNKWGRINDV